MLQFFVSSVFLLLEDTLFLKYGLICHININNCFNCYPYPSVYQDFFQDYYLYLSVSIYLFGNKLYNTDIPNLSLSTSK